MGKVWIFASEQEITLAQIDFIENHFAQFLAQWKAHGKDLQARAEVLDNRFIKILVDESIVQASGCSIDSMIEQIRLLESKLQLTLLNRMNVFYLTEGVIRFDSLHEFKRKLQQNQELLIEAKVYNTGITSESDFATNWLIPVEKSWAKRYL